MPLRIVQGLITLVVGLAIAYLGAPLLAGPLSTIVLIIGYIVALVGIILLVLGLVDLIRY